MKGELCFFLLGAGILQDCSIWVRKIWVQSGSKDNNRLFKMKTLVFKMAENKIINIFASIRCWSIYWNKHQKLISIVKIHISLNHGLSIIIWADVYLQKSILNCSSGIYRAVSVRTKYQTFDLLTKSVDEYNISNQKSQRTIEEYYWCIWHIKRAPHWKVSENWCWNCHDL